jgi:protein involved in polysaccharide export with SLBB domain
MAISLNSRLGRVGVGLAVVGGLAFVAGLDSSIEAKPPTDPAGMLRDLENLPAKPHSAIGRMNSPSESVRTSAAIVAATDRAMPQLIVRTAGVSSGNRFELTGAEKLSIKFQGQQDLSGDYRVNPDESVSVPALGRISITGLSASELEAVLADRAAKVTGRESYITVEVAEYRPIFVSGLVSRPGSHAWQPGMTVLHAVTLLGGIYRATAETSGGALIGADAEILRLRKAINDLKRSSAALARLRAERSNVATIEVPEALVALVGKTEAAALIGEQTSVLANRRSGLTAQLEALERAKAIATQEMTGLVAQGKRLRDMLEQRRVYTGKMEGLLAKGIVRADRTMDEQSKLAELEDRATTVSVGIARVQSMMAQLERDIINLRQERIAETDQEIFKLNKENAQLELEIESSRSSYFKITGAPAPLTFGDKEAPRASIVEYQLVRYEGGVQNTLKVDQFARVKPGDIVIVDVQKD